MNLEKELNKKITQISLIEKYISKAKKGEFMEKYEAKEIVVPSKSVYYKHGVIDSMQDLFNFVLSAEKECGRLNPTLKCKNYCYVTYTAKEYKEKDVELEYVEEVESIGVENETIKFRQDPEIMALSIIHRGKYENLQEAYAYAVNYVKENSYSISGPLREVYIHGCWDEENEDNYVTEIQIPFVK